MSQDIINNRFLEESVFAIADGYCVINLTKNIVRGSMYQVVNGKKYNLNEQLGLPENSSLQSLVDAWALTIPEEGLKDFLHEFDRERLLNRFENGERHISFRYWTRTATFEPMLAEEDMNSVICILQAMQMAITKNLQKKHAIILTKPCCLTTRPGKVSMYLPVPAPICRTSYLRKGTRKLGH